MIEQGSRRTSPTSRYPYETREKADRGRRWGRALESIERDRQETQLAILETASESLYTSRTVLSLGGYKLSQTETAHQVRGYVQEGIR